MASVAPIKREERTGLAIAVAAHVALVAALVWQVRDDPTPLPEPERIEVSLADEVGLVAAAPDPVAEAPAAVAPVLGEAPAPEPDPVVRLQPQPQPRPEPTRVAEARPTPAPRPTARPTPAPTASARPSPRPTQTAAARGGGSRLGEDFLEGAGAGERREAGTPAATFGAAEQASLAQAITRQLKPHWSAPQGPDAELLVTVLRFRLNPDGTLAGTPEVVRQTGVNATNEAQKQRHAEQAIRAVRLAAPFRLPEQFYDHWKVVTSTFDRRL